MNDHVAEPFRSLLNAVVGGSHRPVLDTFDDRTQSIFCRGCRERITDIGGLCIPKNPERLVAEAEPREGGADAGVAAEGLGARSLAKESE